MEILTGGKQQTLQARERLPVEGSADQVQLLSRRSKSGWKRTNVRFAARGPSTCLIALGDVFDTKRRSHDTHPLRIH